MLVASCVYVLCRSLGVPSLVSVVPLATANVAGTSLEVASLPSPATFPVRFASSVFTFQLLDPSANSFHGTCGTLRKKKKDWCHCTLGSGTTHGACTPGGRWSWTGPLESVWATWSISSCTVSPLGPFVVASFFFPSSRLESKVSKHKLSLYLNQTTLKDIGQEHRARNPKTVP